MAAQALLHACTGCGRANPSGAACPNCGARASSGLRFASNQTVPTPPQLRDVAAELVRSDKIREESAATEAVSGVTEWACESCGTPARAGFSFCLGCGEKGAFVRRAQMVVPVSSDRIAPLGMALLVLVQLWHTAWNSPKRMSGVNALTSFLFPGLGQIFAGQGAKGLCLLFLSSFMVYTWDWPPFGVTLLLVRGLLSLDAYRITEKRRKNRRVRDWEWNFKI